MLNHRRRSYVHTYKILYFLWIIDWCSELLYTLLCQLMRSSVSFPLSQPIIFLKKYLGCLVICCLRENLFTVAQPSRRYAIQKAS